MHKITPFLWFEDQAEEAAEFCVSVFPGSKVAGINRYGESGMGVPGTAMTISFEHWPYRARSRRHTFSGLNGGRVSLIPAA
jgi:predicted 3-demethylubiquinone-9 3-methyltransferase (glyoxalase superfamily)